MEAAETDVEPRVDPRVARTLDAVGEAVRDLLVADGWDAVTHQRVAERSGYARNTIYRHFPDRLALLNQAGHFEDAVSHATLVGDLRTDLVAELHAFRAVLFDGPLGIVLASVVERAERSEEVAELRARLVEAGSAQTRALVEQGKAAGDIDPSLDTHDLVAELCGAILYARLCQDRRPSDAVLARIVDGVLATGRTATPSP